jgi:predicted PurR-regulated permease PerM
MLRVVSGYTTGVLLLAFLNGAVAGVAMAVTHTQFVLPLAVWAALIDILPIVGGLLSMIPTGLFAFVHSVPAGITVVVAILVYQQVKNHFLYPVVVGRAVQLNSLLVLVAVLAGSELGHIGGAVLAIPIAGSIQVIVTEIVAFRRETRSARTPVAQAAL